MSAGRPTDSGTRLRQRRLADRAFRLLCALVTAAGLLVLALLLQHIVRTGAGWLDWQFLTSFPSRFPHKAGIQSAIVGTLWMIGLTAAVAVPVGVASAIYLEEYAGRRWYTRIIEVNIDNLAGVPPIVYGLLGLAIFVRGLGLGRSVLAGSLTMALLILPIIIIAAREAIRAVPTSLREAAFALGATRWQTVRDHVLPSALPGILTGIILALSRAMGETAPLIMIGALTYVAFLPEGPLDTFTVLPIQIFNWVSRPQQEFRALAAAAIIVLLVILLLLNATAIWIRQRASRRR
jgi:phosphate transport system permease protein